MTDAVDLREIEKRNYRATFEDGTAELLIGVWLIAFGLLLRTDYSFIGAVLPALLIPIWRDLHRRVSESRLGYVELGEERRQQTVASNVRLGLMVMATLVGGALVYVRVVQTGAVGGPKPLGLGAVPLGVAIAALIGGAGWMYGIPRMIAYAAMVASVFVAGHLIGLYPPVYVALSGVPLLICGVVVLARFVRRYPVPSEDPGHAPR